MQHKKKVSVVLLIAFVLTMLVPCSAFASNFSDITSDHWAIQQIDRMNARGIIGGYEDGTVRANNPVTQFEAVLMASRMMGLEYDAEKSKGTYLPFEYPSWEGAYNSAVAAYEAGLIDASDFKHNGAASREWITKLLIKVLDAEDQLGKSNSTLPFSDKDKISAKYQNYVLLAYDKSLIGGYTDGTFKPANTVTRAELAAFLCRAENQMDVKADNLMLGTVSSINGVSILVEGKDGNSRTLYATTNSNLYDATGNKIGVTGLKEGDAVYVVFTNSLLNYLEVRTGVDYSAKPEVKVTSFAGEITSIIKAKNTIVVTDEDNALRTIVLDGRTSIAYDNNTAKLEFSDLAVGMNVRVKVDNSTQTATEIAIENTTDGQKSGSIYAVDVYDNLITMKEKTGLVTYRMAKKIEVSISGMLTATPSSLKEGDQATYTISDGVMVAIAVGGSSDNFGGNATIESIDTANQILTYKTTAGELKAAYYTKGQTVTFTDGTAGTITDLMAGDSVTITVADNNVAAIKVTSRKLNDGVKGTLYDLSYDNDDKDDYIIITNSNGTRDTYDLATNVKVTQYGETSSLQSLQKGQVVELTLANNKVTRIKANELIEGTVKAVNTSAKTIQITDQDGKTATYNVASDVTVRFYRNSVSRLSAVNEGDVVSMRMNNNEVTMIEVDTQVDMTVYSMNNGSGYMRLVDSSSNYQYVYVDEIDLYVDGTYTTNLNNVSVGDTAVATFAGSTLTKLEINSSGVKGEITNISTGTNTITIKNYSNESKKVILTSGSYVVKDGVNTNINSLKVGDRVIVSAASGNTKEVKVMNSKTGTMRYGSKNFVTFKEDATETWYYTVPGAYLHYMNSTTQVTIDMMMNSLTNGKTVMLTIYYTDKDNVYEVVWDK